MCAPGRNFSPRTLQRTEDVFNQGTIIPRRAIEPFYRIIAARRFHPSNETSAADHRTTTRNTFSRRGYIWSNIRVSVRSRETERERKRSRARERERVRRLPIQLRYKGQSPRVDGRIPGRRRQYFIIQTKHTASEFLILCYFNFQ